MFDSITIINHHCCCRRRAPRLQFAFELGREEPKDSPMPVQKTITTEQKILVTVKPVTHGGKPVELDGPIDVQVMGGLGTFELLPNGRSFYAISPDEIGDTTYLIKGDADLGEGVESVQDTLTLKTIGARAANLGLEVGEPELKGSPE